MEERTWDEFRDSKLLWWMNRSLHLFGWAIVVAMEDGVVVRVYPARVKFRGFDEKSEAEGFKGLTEHISSQIEVLSEESSQVNN